MEPKESTSKKHFEISIIKSCIRIVACATLVFGEYAIAGTMLVLAEILGIVEEL